MITKDLDINRSVRMLIKSCDLNPGISLTNIAIIKDSKIIYNFAKPPYKSETRHLMFSMTKSITSLAVGIACDMGLLSIDDTIAECFLDKLPQYPHENLYKIKIHHLLTMTTGIDHNTYGVIYPENDWIKAFLEQDFPKEPGTFYMYSTHASHMLSALITKVSGQSLEEFLQIHLFDKLDIHSAEWECSPEGLTAGGMGLSLTMCDLAKIVTVLMQSGFYNGFQVISKEYLCLALSTQITKPNNTFGLHEGNGYGFQFHIGKNHYRMDGAFGQIAAVYPQQNMAVIAFSQNTKIESLLEEIEKNQHTDNICSDGIDLGPLTYLTNNRCNIFHISNRNYLLDENELNIGQIQFIDNYLTFIYKNGVTDKFIIDLSSHVYGKSHFIKDLEIHLQEHCISARFEEMCTLILEVYYIETPYVAEYRFIFENDTLQFDFKVNVSFTLKGFSILGHEIPI